MWTASYIEKREKNNAQSAHNNLVNNLERISDATGKESCYQTEMAQEMHYLIKKTKIKNDA